MTSNTAAASSSSSATPATATADATQLPTQPEVIATFKQMRIDLQRLASKVGDFESERDEHRMVLESLKTLDGERKCFRLMNGVLVERKVAQVQPQLQQSIENFTLAMDNFLKLYKKKEQELADYQQKYGIRVESAGQQQQQQGRPVEQKGLA